VNVDRQMYPVKPKPEGEIHKKEEYMRERESAIEFVVKGREGKGGEKIRKPTLSLSLSLSPNPHRRLVFLTCLLQHPKRSLLGFFSSFILHFASTEKLTSKPFVFHFITRTTTRSSCYC